MKLKIMKFVIKSGYAQIPISKELMLALFSLPPNDVNKKFGNIAESSVINTNTRAIKKTTHVTKFENCNSTFLNFNVL